MGACPNLWTLLSMGTDFLTIVIDNERIFGFVNSTDKQDQMTLSVLTVHVCIQQIPEMFEL